MNTWERRTFLTTSILAGKPRLMRPQDLGQHEDELRVPTLLQVLKDLSGMRMVIEMKKAPMEFSPVPRLCELLKEKNMTEKVLVASFYPPFMEQFRRSLPEVATSLSLSLNDAASLTPTALKRFFDKLPGHNTSNEQRPDALQLPHWIITKHLVSKVEERGLALHAWTVNSPNAMDRMKSLGVDGIITDCPAVLLSRLGRTAQGV